MENYLNLHRCKCCSKEYKQKSARDNHEVLCHFQEGQNNYVSYPELIQIVRQLSLKNQILEKKVEEMQKTWRKNKINIQDWLNEPEQMHLTPNYSFGELIMRIEINQDKHILQLLEKHAKVHQVIKSILDDNYSSAKNVPPPIYQHKSNFYYFTTNADATSEIKEGWSLLDKQKYQLFLNQVYVKLVTDLCDWRKKNQDMLEQNDKLSTAYNKAMIKLMNHN
jgi:hypothetical protein